MSQISFSNEEKKEILSTPKFRIDKSINSLERKENTLDTLKQNINSIINIENNETNNELQKDINNKNLILSSLLNKINDKKELNDYYSNQFSFDGKTKNYIITKNGKEYKENMDNNIIIIENNADIGNENNNEIKYRNDVENYIIKSNGKNNENVDNNFNYILPLESDKSSEHFNLISFQGYSEEIENKKIIKFKKIPNQKKISGEKKLYNNPKIINKKRGIGYLSKQKNKNELKLTPHKKNKNNRNIINKPFNSNHKLAKSNYNSSKKKRNYNFKMPSLIEMHNRDKCLTEPNNPFIQMNTIKNSQKETFFTSNNNKNSSTSKKDNKNKNKTKIKTRPFIIEKINNNKKDLRINKIYFTKKNPKNRNSVNFSKKNSITGRNKNLLIYEKNFNSQDSRSFSINKNDNNDNNSGLIHSRNYSQLNNKNNFTYDHSTINKKIKNCVILLSQKNLKNSPFQTRKNSYGNYSISASDCSTQKTIKKIKEIKIYSPFCKSKLLNKQMICNEQNHASSVECRKKIEKNEKYKENHTFISSHEVNNDNQFMIFSNYDSNRNRKILKKRNEIKEKYKSEEINKIIKVNTNNNTLNNTLKNSPNNHTCFMNYNNNKPKNIIEEKKGNLTERFRESYVGPVSIYSKKFVFVNKNIYSTLNNDTSRMIKIRNNINRKNMNKSSVLNHEKNFYIKEFNNNSNNNSISIKDKNKFHEYFNEILSNIDIKENLNNFKKIKTKKEINRNSYNNNSLHFTEKNIFSNHKINSFQPKVKFKNKISKNSFKLNKLETSKQFNTINNSINLGYNNILRKNVKILKKNGFTRGNSLNVPKFRKNIEKYTILRNNQNNKVINEVSIFIGKQSICDKNKNTDLEMYKNNKGNSLINNKKLKAINVNKKTIINVNQFYPSYYINKNENIFKNKKNVTSYL